MCVWQRERKKRGGGEKRKRKKKRKKERENKQEREKERDSGVYVSPIKLSIQWENTLWFQIGFELIQTKSILRIFLLVL